MSIKNIVRIAEMVNSEDLMGNLEIEGIEDSSELEGNIESIEFLDDTEEMCEIEVEDVHCYYANGLLTHNSGQELRILANLSREPGWVDTFLSGGDVHKRTACLIWGEENYDKEKRKKAKVANFGIAYGMSAYSFSDKFKISLPEAEKFVQDYQNSMPTLFRWMSVLKKKAMKEGTVYTYFGRPRRVQYYLSSSDSKMRAFGYRTVVNTVIQGGGADIIKAAIIRVFNNVIRNPQYEKYVAMRNTVHDEVNFVVEKSHAAEIIPEILKNMRLKIKGWPVPMEVGLSIGDAWGYCFDYNFDPVTNEVLGPKGDPYLKKESQVIEEEDKDEEPIEEEEEFEEITF